MTTSSPADEQLFRQFRRSWTPVWMERIFGGIGPLTQLVLIGVAVAVLSWAALTYLPATTGQQVASVESWRQRIDQAEESELVPVFQSLFQVRNDRVIDLGVNYLLSSNEARREAARVAMEDSMKVWRTWEHDESVPHIQRVADSLSRQVSMFNAPEQASAVEVARQFLLWPTGDRDDHTELLLSCETIFRNARAAFAERPEVDRPTNTPLDLPTSAADQVAASLLDDRPSTFVAGREPQIFSAGYRRPSQTTTVQVKANRQTENFANNAPGEITVPMLDEGGQAIGVRTVDPSTLDLPGGLIPVQLSGERIRKNPMNYADDTTHDETTQLPRQSINEVIQERNAIPPAIVPGDENKELEQEPLHQSQDRGLTTGNSQGMGGRLKEIRQPPRRLDRSLIGGVSERSVLPMPQESFGQSGSRGFHSGPGFDEPDRIGIDSDRNREAGQYRSQAPSQPMLRQMPEREASNWQPPSQPLRDWAHIDVMNMLQSTTPTEVTAAETELLRRGFGRSHIAVAYRLTSQDPLERYNLVFDLVKSQRVEPIPFLKWLSDDRHPEVRTAATQQLQLLTEQPLR